MFGRKTSILDTFNPLNRLSALRKRRDSEESGTISEGGERASSSGAGEGDRASRNGSFVFFGRRHSAVEEAGLFRLSASELAFLPLEVRRRLGKTVGHLPAAPSVFKSRGTVLFVDVSGFTKLGMELARENGNVRGAQLLAEEITQVLARLTEICLEHGGDVSKYAGDALLCVFDSGNRHKDEELMYNKAKQCAVAQLQMMQTINTNTKLDIHGGICHGSLLHFHLGSADDRLRWYLMAGEAMAGAANLVDIACPGEILCAGSEDDFAFGGMSFRTPRLSAQGGSFLDYRMTADSEQLSANVADGLPGAPVFGQQHQHHLVLGGGSLPSSRSLQAQSVDGSSPGEAKKLTPTPQSMRGGGPSKHPSTKLSLNLSPGTPLYVVGGAGGGSQVRKGTNPLLQAKNTFYLNTENRGTLLSERTEAFLSRNAGGQSQRSLRAGTLMSHHSEDAAATSGVEILTSRTQLPAAAASSTTRPSSQDDDGDGYNNNNNASSSNLADDASLRAGLPRSCNVYIPAALRAKGAMEDVMPEMKSNVSIVFVEMEDMVLTEDELMREAISDTKLDLLNSCFVKMTRIAHAFGGEVRDMLFDDKGCVFIAVFGAHHVDHELSYLERLKETQANTVGAGGMATAATSGLKSAKSRLNLLSAVAGEPSQFRAVKAAMAITTIVNSAHVGVSSGSCFVGMCGTDKRHDFVVIGHEVNMAARLMVQAKRNEILVSEEVYEACREHIPFTERQVFMQKSNAQAGSTAFVADSAYAQQESFLAQFRYDLFDSDLFVGRSEELASVEQSLDKMCLSQMKQSASGCIVIDAALGTGKSAFVSRVRKMGKGRISICHSRCRDFAPEFGPWRAVLESLTGLRPDMKAEEMKDRLHNFDRKSSNPNSTSTSRIDIAAIAKILPFVADAFDLTTSTGALLHNVPEDGAAAAAAVDRQVDYFGSEFKQTIAKVGKAVASLLVMGNAESRKAGAKGTLVILENLEKIDVPSLLLLEYLVDHLDATKRLALCLTVLTKRPTTTTTPPSSSADGGAAYEQRVTDYVYAVVDKASKAKCKLRLHLHGLKEEDVALLVTRFLGHSADGEVLCELYRLTRGSPMHLTNLLQYCREHDIITRTATTASADFHFASTAKAQLLNSPELMTVEGVIRVRFDQGVDDDTKNLLRLAANIRGEFDAIFLQQAHAAVFPSRARLEFAFILQRLRVARKLGFLAVYVEDKSSPEEEHAWGLKHDTVADVICSTVTPEQVASWEPLLREPFRALELRLQLGFFGRVDDFDLV